MSEPRLLLRVPAASVLGSDDCVLRMLEPPDADHEDLLGRVRRGTYDKPFIAEDGETRSLLFSLAYVQSRMRIDDPVSLELCYTRKMMSVLLFHMNPQDILVLGLGGGSLVKFCYRYLARAQIDVVENNADVMALRREFAVPQNDARLRVVEDDAGQFVAGAARRQYDVVFSDAFDRHGLAPTLCERDFYDALRTRLRPTGIVVANIAGLKDERAGYIRLLSESFGDNMLVVEVEEDDNEVVFAFKDPMFEPRWRWMERQAAAMERRYNVEFPRFVRALRRGRRNVMPPASMVEG